MDTSRSKKEQLPRQEVRPNRQNHYLQTLKSFTPEEVQYFLGIYNRVALQKAVSEEIYTYLSEESRRHQPGRPVDELLGHFVSVFEIWLRGVASLDDTLVNQSFPVLEDLNIAVLAFHNHYCLNHARQHNARIKAIKQSFYEVSLN